MVIKSNLKSVHALSPAALEAGQRCQETLLNCYCREVAGPEGQLSVGPLFGQNDWPMALRMCLQRDGGQVMHVQLPHTGERLLTVVTGASPTGNFRYRSPLYHKAPGKPWALLDWEATAVLLLNELSLKHGVPTNTELLDQIHNSVAVTTAALSVPAPSRAADNAAQAYIDSEQSLTFGHPFHPAPKSRQGFSDADLQRYSPEMRICFALHYFAVRREDIAQQSLLGQSCAELTAPHAPAVDEGLIALPVHPWQASYLLGLPLVREAISCQRLHYLGPRGEAFFPTSSIRTLYQPGNPYFYKFSLNIRITNCVRKNAWYELESAMQVTRLLRPLLPALLRQFDGLRVLEEPAFMSVNLRDPDTEANRDVIEGFGMILRESVDNLLLPGASACLAGALFGNHTISEARLRNLLEGIAYRESMAFDDIAERWFAQYVERLLYPVMYCFFAHGLIFEPHLQNVVLGLRNDWPRQIFLRDFEGVKLVSERYPEARLPDIGPRARESLWYSAELGWNRIAYCLFVNNFCEAIGQLAPESSALQRRLWGVVRHHLHYYQSHYGDATSARRINAVLAGQPFPGKANLINRFFKRPDRATPYVPVTNPIATAGEGTPWS